MCSSDLAQMLAIISWCRRYMRLRAIVDTAGKSLHGWFDYPGDEVIEELRVVLRVLDCDPAMLKASQPVRLPGTRRKDKNGLPWQRLIWLDAAPTTAVPLYRTPIMAMTTISKDGGRFWSAGEIWETQFAPVQYLLPPEIGRAHV